MLVDLRHLVDASDAFRSATRDIMLAATSLGGFDTLALVVIGCAGFLACLGRSAIGLRLIIASAVGAAGANLLKLAFVRPRPEVVQHWADAGGWSFPSGHSASSAVVYLLLGQVAALAAPTVAAKRFVVGFALAVVLLVGLSRVYLGVHWPTDVLAGWTLGGAWAWFIGARLGWSWPPERSAQAEAEFTERRADQLPVTGNRLD